MYKHIYFRSYNIKTIAKILSLIEKGMHTRSPFCPKTWKHSWGKSLSNF